MLSKYLCPTFLIHKISYAPIHLRPAFRYDPFPFIRLSREIPNLREFAKEISKRQDIREVELLSGSRKRGVVKARKIFCQAVVKGAGYSGAEVARFLGISTSAVNRLTNSDEIS